MASNLTQIIFDQFLDYVNAALTREPCTFNPCDFDYRVRVQIGLRLLEVVFNGQDCCGRRTQKIATIDYTNICIEDLTDCKWNLYLEKLAKSFVHEICPVEYIIVKNNYRDCKKETPRWRPPACTVTTTIIESPIIPDVIPEPQVIIERQCECIQTCNHRECPQPEHIIIRQRPCVPCVPCAPCRETNVERRSGCRSCQH